MGDPGLASRGEVGSKKYTITAGSCGGRKRQEQGEEREEQGTCGELPLADILRSHNLSPRPLSSGHAGGHVAGWEHKPSVQWNSPLLQVGSENVNCPDARSTENLSACIVTHSTEISSTTCTQMITQEIPSPT